MLTIRRSDSERNFESTAGKKIGTEHINQKRNYIVKKDDRNSIKLLITQENLLNK